MSANFNALAQAARGEFLVAIGDDDRLLPEFVSRLVGVMRPELRVAFSNHYLITADGKRLELESHEAKGKREPILASNWDDMNPSMTDGNPADNRIIQILSAFKCRFLWPNTGSPILT
jgi:hypothetical protein